MSIEKKYTTSEEIINSLTHTVGAVIGFIICSIFLTKTYQTGDSIAIFSLCLYMFGVVSSYTASSAYHACPARYESSKAILRKFDHVAIYLHIAGSYSPITLIAMLKAGESIWAWSIFGFVWICAIIGCILSLRKLKSHSYLKTACYVLMGLSILIAFKPFYDSVGLSVVLWVVAEGISYITGAILYSLKNIRYTHSIFHIFVIFGDIFHFVAIWKILNLFLIF